MTDIQEDSVDIVIGEVTGPASRKQQMVVEAVQLALENAPPPGSRTDVQSFRIASIEFEHGGFVGSTTTRVSLEVKDGPMSRHGDKR
jgi:hypothetical protein